MARLDPSPTARTFGPLVDLDGEAPPATVRTAGPAEEAAFLDQLRRGVIGADARLRTPEGEKPLLYFDYIASGRFHRAVEDVLNERVLPYMANTHTETSATGRAMTHWYERSFRRIGRCVGGSRTALDSRRHARPGSRRERR